MGKPQLTYHTRDDNLEFPVKFRALSLKKGKIMTIIEAYVVYTGATEHLNGEPTFYFTHQGTADKVAEKRGWYGGKAHVAKHKIVKLQDGSWSVYKPVELDFDPDGREGKIKAAKAKLTREEIELLGLDDFT